LSEAELHGNLEGVFVGTAIEVLVKKLSNSVLLIEHKPFVDASGHVAVETPTHGRYNGHSNTPLPIFGSAQLVGVELLLSNGTQQDSVNISVASLSTSGGGHLNLEGLTFRILASNVEVFERKIYMPSLQGSWNISIDALFLFLFGSVILSLNRFHELVLTVS
jgi:hypothetical protein